jgi:hypothetical protein
MRTTLDIDASLLRQVKRLARHRRKSIGTVVSELLAVALGEMKQTSSNDAFEWASKPMKARVDLNDKDAVFAVLDSK